MLCRRHLLACCLLPIMAIAAMAASPASAQIRRCASPEGGHVYTDRECADIGAVDRGARAGVAGATGRLIRRDCSRSVQDVIFELGQAIDHRDVNRLAGIYHWPGTSSRSAYAIMQRLDAIVQRPLVDITPIQPPAPVASAPPPSTLAWVPVSPGSPVRTVAPAPAPEPADADALPDEVRAAAERRQNMRRAPVGLAVDQTVRDRITPLQTVFSLRRHLDCWWVSL